MQNPSGNDRIRFISQGVLNPHTSQIPFCSTAQRAGNSQAGGRRVGCVSARRGRGIWTVERRKRQSLPETRQKPPLETNCSSGLVHTVNEFPLPLTSPCNLKVQLTGKVVKTSLLQSTNASFPSWLCWWWYKEIRDPFVLPAPTP